VLVPGKVGVDEALLARLRCPLRAVAAEGGRTLCRAAPGASALVAALGWIPAL
jgi:hypothetical protein